MKFKLLLLCSFIVMSSQVSTAMNQAAAGKVVAGKKVKARQAPVAKQEDSKDKSFAEAAGAAKAPETKLSEVAQPAAASAEVSLAAAVVTAAAVATGAEVASPATPKAANASAAAPAVASSAAEGIQEFDLQIPHPLLRIGAIVSPAYEKPAYVMDQLTKSGPNRRVKRSVHNQTELARTADTYLVAQDRPKAYEFVAKSAQRVGDEPKAVLDQAARRDLRKFARENEVADAAEVNKMYTEGIAALQEKLKPAIERAKESNRIRNLTYGLAGRADEQSDNEEEYFDFADSASMFRSADALWAKKACKGAQE